MALVGCDGNKMGTIQRGSHQNKNSETYIVLGNPFTMQVADTLVTLNPGDVYIIAPGIRHGLFQTPDGYKVILIEGNESGIDAENGKNLAYQADTYQEGPFSCGQKFQTFA